MYDGAPYIASLSHVVLQIESDLEERGVLLTRSYQVVDTVIRSPVASPATQRKRREKGFTVSSEDKG